MNHANFIRDGNNDTETLDSRFDNVGTSDFLIPGNLFDFFAPLPPRFLPPTKKPSKKPTPSPVVTPTSPPIPAGRFPSPVTTPTFNPVVGKPSANQPPTFVPVTVGHWPQQTVGTPSPKPSPTITSNQRPLPPYFAPNANNNQKPPPTFAPHPVQKPSPVPTNHPVSKPFPPPTPTPVQPKIETRIASYTAEWGSDVNKCQYVIPNVFFTCHDGGIIEIMESKNAKCTRVGNDRVQCTQDQFDSDSSIEFTCSGIRKVHLMSTATVGPSLAVNCQKGGNAVKFLTLSRKCDDHMDVNPTCYGGIPWKQGDIAYCASPVMCDREGTCNEVPLQPVTMSNTNTDMRCSHAAPDQDMQNHSFDASSLASITLVDWRVSGQSRGCLWKSPPLLVRCQDGGKLEFMENYPFCFMLPEDNMGECQSFAPYSVEKEESIGIFIKCTGQTENQLVLSAEIPSQNVDVECDPEGTIIQSIMLSRGCGEYGTDGFTLMNHPSFCHANEEVYTADDNHSHCFVGDTCMFNEGCNNIHLPPLIANTRSNAVEKCTFVV